MWPRPCFVMPRSKQAPPSKWWTRPTKDRGQGTSQPQTFVIGSSIGKRAGLGHVHPHMLRAAFIMAALDAGVPLRDVQTAARHADPRTTTIYDRRRQNSDRHAAYVVVSPRATR